MGGAAAALAGGGARVPAVHVARQPARAPLVGLHALPGRLAGHAGAAGQGAPPRPWVFSSTRCQAVSLDMLAPQAKARRRP